MDTITLKREIDVMRRTITEAEQKKRSLNGAISDFRTTVTKYTRDYETATAKAEGYKRDLDRATKEFDEKNDELKKVDSELRKSSDEMLKLEREFKQLSEQIRRMQSSAANSNGAQTSQQRRS